MVTHETGLSLNLFSYFCQENILLREEDLRSKYRGHHPDLRAPSKGLHLVYESTSITLGAPSLSGHSDIVGLSLCESNLLVVIIISCFTFIVAFKHAKWEEKLIFSTIKKN